MQRNITQRMICTSLAAAMATATAMAQTGPWTLTQCIDHALSHSITIKQQQTQIDQRTLQLQTARAARLPDLSASAGENFSFGRGLTADNTYTNTNTSSTSFSIGTSVPLFTGFQIPNQISLSRLNLEAATKDLERARNDISAQVARQYVEALYDLEILDVARRQIAIDSLQAERLKAMLDAGRTSRAELAAQQATLAQSRLTATQAEANVKLALLNLAQLLELTSPEGFAIVRPQTTDDSTASIPTPDDIFAKAVATRPEVEAERIRLKATAHSIKLAQAGLWPQLSLSAGLGTNYYNTSGFHSDGFASQLKNNFSQYIGLNLSVPIFNRLQTRNNIRSARVEQQNQQLQIDATQKQLYKEIQQAYYAATNAAAKLTASQEARHAASEAFTLTQAKYEQGKATVTEFNEARNNMLKAESDITQARYEFLYQRTLIDFYQGKALTF